MAKSDSPYSQDLIDKMVLLIKEELHHFYQVLEIMESRGVEYKTFPQAATQNADFTHEDS